MGGGPSQGYKAVLFLFNSFEYNFCVISTLECPQTTWNVDLVADLVIKLVPIPNRASDFATGVHKYMIVLFNPRTTKLFTVTN